MAARKAKVEYYWTVVRKTPAEKQAEHDALKGAGKSKQFVLPTKNVVNWRLVGANGEIMCQCTQGFRDKADAQRSVWACGDMLAGVSTDVRHVGPGRKP